MNVKVVGNYISIENWAGMNGEMIDRDEAYQLLEDLTEALKRCPVSINEGRKEGV